VIENIMARIRNFDPRTIFASSPTLQAPEPAFVIDQRVRKSGRSS
jgi:hypothetical protein